MILVCITKILPVSVTVSPIQYLKEIFVLFRVLSLPRSRQAREKNGQQRSPSPRSRGYYKRPRHKRVKGRGTVVSRSLFAYR